MDNNNYTIIAVDDSKSILTFIRSILVREGYSVYTAASGFEVLDMIKDVVPDILRHRIMLSYEAEAEGFSTDDLIKRILDELRTP